MPGSNIPHIAHVEWSAFKVSEDRQAEWLSNPTETAGNPRRDAAATMRQETNARRTASMLAQHDQTLCNLRRRLRRNEGKISKAVDRGAAPSELARRERKVDKLRYLLTEVQASKRRLLQQPGHECAHGKSLRAISQDVQDVPVNLHSRMEAAGAQPASETLFVQTSGSVPPLCSVQGTAQARHRPGCIVSRTMLLCCRPPPPRCPAKAC